MYRLSRKSTNKFWWNLQDRGFWDRESKSRSLIRKLPAFITLALSRLVANGPNLGFDFIRIWTLWLVYLRASFEVELEQRISDLSATLSTEHIHLPTRHAHGEVTACGWTVPFRLYALPLVVFTLKKYIMMITCPRLTISNTIRSLKPDNIKGFWVEIVLNSAFVKKNVSKTIWRVIIWAHNLLILEIKSKVPIYSSSKDLTPRKSTAGNRPPDRMPRSVLRHLHTPISATFKI